MDMVSWRTCCGTQCTSGRGIHTEEQKQVGSCAAIPLLGLNLTNVAENIVTVLLSHIGTCMFWYGPDTV